VESVGGQLLGSYQDPLGREPVLVAILPIESVEPTPFQRDLSQAHHRRLRDVLDRTGMFLDPIIAVTAPKKGSGRRTGCTGSWRCAGSAPAPSRRSWCRSARSRGRSWP
jgi:hypothetical protein